MSDHSQFSANSPNPDLHTADFPPQGYPGQLPHQTNNFGNISSRPLDLQKSEREAKSRRTKRSLIIAIIILVIVAAALSWLGYKYFLAPNQTANPGLTAVVEINPDDLVQAPVQSAPVYSTSNIPNLTGFFGLTADQASAQLGDGWTLTKEEAQNNPDSPDVATLVTYNYTATLLNSGDDASTSTSLAVPPTANLYLSLDQSGQVIDVYYTADLQLLAYPDVSFMDLLGTDSIVKGALDLAGVSPKDFTYSVPDLDSTLTYDNPNSQNPKIMKQSQIFSGRTSSDGAPTAWVVKISYEFIPAVTSADDFADASRSIVIQLS